MLTLPFIGRTREFRLLSDACDGTVNGHGTLVLLSGDGGVGKTRLVQEVAKVVAANGWQLALGRAFPLETAIPYAVFADALSPLLGALDSGTLMRLTRGDRGVLAALVPQLPAAQGERGAAMFTDSVTPAEQRVRLHTAILNILGKLAEKQPVLLCLENLQWADSASVELLHFLGRQLAPHKVLIVASWNETDQPLAADFRLALRSLRGLGATELHLGPLSESDVTALLAAYFAVDAEVLGPFSARLFHATQGNAFFIEQTLRELIARGDLKQQGQVWVGWHLEDIALPPSVCDVLAARLARFSHSTRRLAELLAVAGTTATDTIVREVAATTLALNEQELRTGLQELREAAVIVERIDGVDIAYVFTHPMLQQALVNAIGLARERSLHGVLALAVEHAFAGDIAQAEAIAAHWQRADPRTEPARAVHWLALAGRSALRRVARREAAASLRAALDRADANPGSVPAELVADLVDELARVYRRLAEYHEAIAMSERAREIARAGGRPLGIAVAERRIGLSLQGLGRREDALAHFDVAVRTARAEGDDTLVVRALFAKGDCLQALGMVDEAKREVNEALATAERLDQLPLLARAHRMLLVLHLWTGPAHRAWTHARRAVELAERTGERNLAWSAHFFSAVLGGLTSNTAALAAHLAEATRLAQELASPLLELRTTEISLEYRAGIGDWDRALADGERALVLGRALDQTTLLARIAHWVSGVYMQRGDFVAAQRLVQEAWEVSGAAHLDLSRPFEVHGVLPAYVARTRYLHAVGEHEAALTHGRVALAIADRTNYIAWAVYRLMPTMASAAMALGDQRTLREVRERLAVEAERLAHPIGLAWVSVIDGEVARVEARYEDAVRHLHRAIEALEAVPYRFDAAEIRLRLARIQLAGGARHEAVYEAQAALSLFETLGARGGIDRTHELLRELGARIPTAAASSTWSTLTSREVEIVKLVAQRLSNKEIGAKLGITARTAGTHLANVYDKLGVRDRTALGDLAREQGLHH
ncbi:helix-turn-helix transcriptional regulator [Gemmatimonas sp.]